MLKGSPVWAAFHFSVFLWSALGYIRIRFDLVTVTTHSLESCREDVEDGVKILCKFLLRAV